MSSSLPLVIDVVDLIDEAAKRQRPLDAEAEAERLVMRHPEADVTKESVAQTIREEEEAAGVARDVPRLDRAT